MHGSIIVADITRGDTIEHIDDYINIINEIVPNTPIVIALNKSDKIDDKDAQDILKNLQSKYKNGKIFLTSAKSGLNVEEIFSTLATDILNK